ncbi:MAG: DMT family transporter [Cellvibrionaceae bacterium]
MQHYIAYGAVVLLWSTTPLAIQFSNSSFDFATAVSLRMIIAFVVAFAALGLFRFSMPLNGQAIKSYFAASLGIFPAMPLVYWAAQYISSGLVAVLFGVMPFAVGVFSYILYRENIFTRRKTLALVLAVVGIGIIFSDQLTVSADSVYGIAGVLLSTAFFAISALWTKQIGAQVGALPQTVGALGFSLPSFALLWLLVGSSLPEQVEEKSMMSIAYLAIVGSVFGFTLYFYIVKKFTAQSVSLITLITPVLALAFGSLFANEAFSMVMLLGGGLVMVALVFYQNISFLRLFNR